MIPAVGKSGAGMISISSSTLACGFFSRCWQASITSFRLCGGMLVAMPTAMPDEPLTSRLGNRDGSTVGSSADPSKLAVMSTVSSSMFANRCMASGDRRHSV